MEKSNNQPRPVRAVRFPLKLKLLTVMILLIASSLTIFVGIALKIFREDKSAYIYETLLNKASSSQLILSHKLNSLSPAAAFELKEGKLVFGQFDLVALLQQEVQQDSAFKLDIVIPMQNEFYGLQDGKLVKVPESQKEVLAGIFRNSINQAVKEIDFHGEKRLFAFDYNPRQGFIFTASLSQEKAFAATAFLIKRSVQYGIFILGAAMLLSVLLARPLTSQLELLLGMTKDIAQGNFEKRVSVKGHDEVGALSDSVNDMADKIVQYMEEMKEKARLENEVAVAQLVQSSFFPQTSMDDSDLKVFGHFEPASECGGDWWGMLDHGDWRIVFIADATGHGVPAALLTATINCCKSSLSFMLESKPDLLARPEEILRYMNHAVHSAGKEIQVTCFVASFNRRTKEFIYANSSHPAPLLFSPKEGELNKDCFNPLMEANGPRLGQASESRFSSHKLILKTHDTIFFYTDGLPEAQDQEGTRWGERRMIKSLASNGLGSPEDVVTGVFRDLKTFMAEKPKDDDFTAVALKVIS